MVNEQQTPKQGGPGPQSDHTMMSTTPNHHENVPTYKENGKYGPPTGKKKWGEPSPGRLQRGPYKLETFQSAVLMCSQSRGSSWQRMKGNQESDA